MPNYRYPERESAVQIERWFQNRRRGIAAPNEYILHHHFGDISVDVEFGFSLPATACVVHAAYMGCSGFTDGSSPTIVGHVAMGRGTAPTYTPSKDPLLVHNMTTPVAAAGWSFDDSINIFTTGDPSAAGVVKKNSLLDSDGNFFDGYENLNCVGLSFQIDITGSPTTADGVYAGIIYSMWDFQSDNFPRADQDGITYAR